LPNPRLRVSLGAFLLVDYFSHFGIPMHFELRSYFRLRRVCKARRSKRQLGRRAARRFLPRFAVPALFFAQWAHAADLPNLKEPGAEAPPAFTWTGFYIGVNGGYGIDHYAFNQNYLSPAGFEQSSSGITASGVVLGGQAGYNYEITGLPLIDHAVVGIEVDSDWSSVRGTTTIVTPLATLTYGGKLENFGTLRGRIGYNFDRLLLYLTGGLTYATSEADYTVNGISGSSTVTRTGLFPRIGVAGAGAEYAITDHFALRAEYLYDFSGARFVQFYPTPTSRIGFGTRSMYHIARIGLDYRFDFFGSGSQ